MLDRDPAIVNVAASQNAIHLESIVRGLYIQRYLKSIQLNDRLKPDRDCGFWLWNPWGVTRSLAFGSMLGNVRLESGITSEHLLLVLGASVVQNGMSDHHQQFLATSAEPAGERRLPGHVD